VALVWAREGAKVLVSDLNADTGEETVALVRAQGGEAHFHAADVAKPEDAQALVEQALKHFGRFANTARFHNLGKNAQLIQCVVHKIIL
jgi:NAD(P)-dependent dehydrogenase (short-subunit alcohol dehydrogenase family)